MKTTILICIGLLFGFTVSAQDSKIQPDSPYATYKHEQQMNPDYNDPPPLCIYVKNNYKTPNSIQASGNKLREKCNQQSLLYDFPNSTRYFRAKKPCFCHD